MLLASSGAEIMVSRLERELVMATSETRQDSQSQMTSLRQGRGAWNQWVKPFQPRFILNRRLIPRINA